MKREDLFDAIGQADDEYIVEADTTAAKKRHPNWMRMGGIAACLCLVGLGVYALPNLLSTSGSSSQSTADSMMASTSNSIAANDAAIPLAEAVYPQLPTQPLESDYPDTDEGLEEFLEAYMEYRDATKEQAANYTLSDSDMTLDSAILSFVQQTVPLVMAGDGSENRVYSPTNLYYALGMMAETVTGQAQSDLLTLLGLEEDSLSQALTAMWNQLHQDDGISKTVLSNSLWIDSSVADSVNRSLLEQLAADAYTSSYQVDMGTEEANEAISQWIDQQTGGLLTEQLSQMATDPNTVLDLVSTLYFYDQWIDEFHAENNTTGTFTCGDGTTVDAEFMNQTQLRGFLRSDTYNASSLSLKGSDYITFVLPNEGTSPEELLQDPDFLNDLLTSEDTSYGEVIWSIPKFDISDSLDLTEALESLNLTSLFDGTADFSPLGEGLFLGGVSQTARVMVDEKGVSAGSYTEIQYSGSMEPQDTCNMILDRPFLFVIYQYTSIGNFPLYVGIVNVP
jgi:serpin B